jgi:hemolysin activation/secretion protein
LFRLVRFAVVVGVASLIVVAAPARAQAPTAPVSDNSSGETATFDIGELRVRGNTLLDAAAVERVIYPYLGENKTITDVEAAREQLERRYHDAGYATVVVNIPEQEVAAGVVTLEVLEGRVDTLRIVGARYYSLAQLRSEVPALGEGVIPYLPEVQAQLAAANARAGDRAVTPVLRAGRTPGTLDVELRVKDSFPLHGDIELNDRYSPDTSKLRLSASLRYDNLWQRQHSLSLQYQTSPQEPSEVKVISGTYLWRYGDGTRPLVFYGVNSDSETATVGALNVIGKGRIYGMRWVVPLAAETDYFHSVSAGLDYKDFDESVKAQGADTLNTPIDYTNWSVQYNATVRSARSLTQFGVGPNFGIRGISNDAQEFEDKRHLAKPNYFYVRANVDSTLSFAWNSQLALRLDGQLSDSPLISNEQFSAGGAQSVRGYLEAQALGDDGYVANLEWRSPSFGSAIADAIQELRAIAFVDAAYLRIRQPLPEQARDEELLGAGLGLRLSAWNAVLATLDWAYPFNDLAPVAKGDDRWHFSLRWSF